MPPTRTVPPAKAIKTERTHEENQERAYIAASRRSDRSLEARVESARRASEIHKRRTGRSLRVTEQDVINEEMYEEEDDDYRRFTAHLHTDSVQFNRRLNAYLYSQMAMRTAMDHMINNSYAQQYPNAPQFAHSQNRMGYQQPMAAGGMTASPTAGHRASPYPSPHVSAFRPPHNRSYSTTTPNEAMNTAATPGSSALPNGPDRRMSTPADFISSRPAQPLHIEDVKPDTNYQRQTQSAFPANSNPLGPIWEDIGPFTTALPPESQQMLGAGMDPRDPLASMFMAGSETFTSSPYYPWGNMQNQNKFDMSAQDQGGMYSTLAPSVLDKSLGPTMSMNLKAAEMNPSLKREGSGGSTQTNGDGLFDSFVKEENWADDAASRSFVKEEAWTEDATAR